MLTVALCVLWVYGDDAMRLIAGGMVESLSNFDMAMVSDGDATVMRSIGRLTTTVAPILGVMFAAGIVVNVTQVGLVLTPSKLAPKLSHLSPLAGVKRILSVRGWMRLAFGIFKVGVIAVVAYISIVMDAESVMSLATLTTGQTASLMFRVLMRTGAFIAAALLILALAEFAFQKWKHEQDLMMTDQELRDEMKENEGDPEVAQRRRQMQRQMMAQRADNDVPTADVVVSNPTELAIAIRYDPHTMPAPVVVAKGAGVMAQKIRRIALENEIPVVERKPLAQFLYKTVEVGGEVPPDQYQAVAEVLRYVYQLKGKKIPQAAA